jgi:superfamily I DNA and RNA helicase
MYPGKTSKTPLTLLKTASVHQKQPPARKIVLINFNKILAYKDRDLLFLF